MNTNIPNDPHETAATSQTRRRRWWIPITILVLASANIARIRMSSELDIMFKNMQTMLTVLVALVLLLVWWLFLNGVRWRTRLLAVGIAVLAVIGLKQLLRMDGLDGSGTPQITWRWTPRKDGNIPSALASAHKMSSKIEATSDYPGYLGSDRSGVVHGARLDPNWNSHQPQELWRQPIGLGWSGFAVTGFRAVTQEQRGPDELVVCYDLGSGSILWAHTNLVRFNDPLGGDGPRATPTVSNGRVYALGATGILDCLDLASGRLLWSHATLKENDLPNMVWGKCSSPLPAGDVIVVTGGMTNRSTLLAYRRDDGALAWRTGEDQASFASPVLANLGGREQILSINASTVTGNDPTNGQTLWQYAWGNNKWPKCAQPVVLDGGRVFLSASFNAGCVMLQVNAEQDGKLAAKELWRNRNLKSEFSNIVAHDGFLYGLDDGILTCVDATSGVRKWKDGHYGHGQVILADDLLLIQTEKGPIALLAADPTQFREIGRLKALTSKTWSTPALAGEYLIVRNDQEAVCYRLPQRLLQAAK